MIGVGSSLGVMIGLRAMERAQTEMNAAIEHLATGRRINRASDDPSGVIVGNQMEAELKSISKDIDGNTFEEKRLGAIDGAQGALSDLLLELQGLVVHSANRGATSTTELRANQDQADAILQAIDHVAETTTFDGQKVIQHLTARGLGINELAGGARLNLIDGNAEEAQHTIQSAIDNLATQRAGLGIREKDIQTNIRQLREKFENLSGAHSQIVDTDYAAETSKMVRASVLREVARFVTQVAQKQNADIVKELLG